MHEVSHGAESDRFKCGHTLRRSLKSSLQSLEESATLFRLVALAGAAQGVGAYTCPVVEAGTTVDR